MKFSSWSIEPFKGVSIAGLNLPVQFLIRHQTTAPFLPVMKVQTFRFGLPSGPALSLDTAQRIQFLLRQMMY